MVVGRENPLGSLFVDALACAEPGPEVVSNWDIYQIIIASAQKIVLDKTMPVRGIGKLQPENLSVFLGLLQAITRIVVDCLGLDDGYREIAAVPEKIVGTFLRASLYLRASNYDPAIGKASLFADLFVCPAS